MDEFLVVNDPATKFPDVLREYENFGGLVINWRLVGSSGEGALGNGRRSKTVGQCLVWLGSLALLGHVDCQLAAGWLIWREALGNGRRSAVVTKIRMSEWNRYQLGFRLKW